MLKVRRPADGTGATLLDLDHRGLPAESDLVGLRGNFRRDDKDVAVRFGAADLQADAHRDFADQQGLHALAPAKRGNVVLRQMHDRANGRAVHLATLPAPLKLENAEHASFACVDVPIAEPGGANLLQSFATDAVVRANAASREWNHVAGFRWSLLRPGGKDCAIIVDGLVFEPMALREFRLADTGTVALIRIEGRLRVPLSSVHPASGAPNKMPAATGTVFLELKPSQDGCYVAALSASDLSLELADPDTFEGIAPRLQIATLPVTGGSTAAIVTYDLDGDLRTMPVTVTRNASGLSVTVPATPNKAPNTVRFARIRGACSDRNQAA